jgi:hypothetical protein
MSVRSLCLAVLACVALAGCYTIQIRTNYVSGISEHMMTTKRCGGDCALDIEVEEYGGGRCRVKPIDAIWLQGNRGNRDIDWTIVTRGFEFSPVEHRYAFYVKYPPPPDNIKDVKIHGNGQKLKLKWEHKNEALGHEYGLNVRRTDGRFCDPLDPWLIS